LIAIATQCFAPDVGGVETTMTGLADNLALSGCDVRVFADRIHNLSAPPFMRDYPVLRYGFVRPWRRWRKRMAIGALDPRALEGVFADSWKSVEAIPPTRAPIAVFAHGAELPLDATTRKARRVIRALRRGNAIIANSAYTADLVRALLGSGAPRIVVVRSPIPPQPEPTPEALARIDAIIAGRGPVVSTLARLEPRKGVDAVLRALPALRERHPGVVYIVAGGGEDRARLETLTAELGLTESVHFLGRVDDSLKAAMLTRTDVFAMPARREGTSVEGYGLVYIEAAWRGAPSLAGREGGAADAVIDGETGLLCDGADPTDVAATLSRMLGDEAFRKTLGANAARRAREELTWAVALPLYRAALDR
jgi:phosphatidylinositol alpha-1,6-mannosyltransferase